MITTQQTYDTLWNDYEVLNWLKNIKKLKLELMFIIDYKTDYNNFYYNDPYKII